MSERAPFVRTGLVKLNLPHTPVISLSDGPQLVSMCKPSVCLSWMIASFKRMGTFVYIFIMVSLAPCIQIVDTC